MEDGEGNLAPCGRPHNHNGRYLRGHYCVLSRVPSTSHMLIHLALTCHVELSPPISSVRIVRVSKVDYLAQSHIVTG